MFEGLYNYTQVVAKCVAEGGIIAMAKDKDTFNFLYKMFIENWMSGGTINGPFLDGTKNHTNSGPTNWYCLNTGGNCPDAMPWQPGQPNYPQTQDCMRLSAQYNQGAGDSRCRSQRMALCKILNA